jgi:hypothetical protein
MRTCRAFGFRRVSRSLVYQSQVFSRILSLSASSRLRTGSSDIFGC